MTRKKRRPSRKRKGRKRGDILRLPKSKRYVKGELGMQLVGEFAQRGPTAPPTATRMDMELVEPIDRALGRGAAHLTAPPSPQMQQCKVPAFLAQMMGQAGSKPYRKPHRPFADQQPRILSQMEREDWR